MTSLEKAVAQAHEFRTCLLLRMGPDSPEFVAAAQTQENDILTCIASMSSIGIEIITRVLTDINKGPFRAEFQTLVTTSILSKQRMKTSVHEGRAQLQTHHYPENYLTEEDWSNIQSDNLTFSSKASVIIRRLRLFGLNTPSETTYVHIVALMYCANKAHYAVNVNPVTALATVRDVKVLFKSWNSRVGSFMYDFPMSPDDLKKGVGSCLRVCLQGGPASGLTS